MNVCEHSVARSGRLDRSCRDLVAVLIGVDQIDHNLSDFGRYRSHYGDRRTRLPWRDKGWHDALAADPALSLGLNTHNGKLTNEPVAVAHGLPHTELAEVLDR